MTDDPSKGTRAIILSKHCDYPQKMFYKPLLLRVLECMALGFKGHFHYKYSPGMQLDWMHLDFHVEERSDFYVH